MLQVLHHWFAPTPRRLVQGSLGMLFFGGLALGLGALALVAPDDARPALLANRLPGWPTFWVPEGPAGYTLAAMLVCVGVWSLGIGLRLARGHDPAR